MERRTKVKVVPFRQAKIMTAITRRRQLGRRGRCCRCNIELSKEEQEESVAHGDHIGECIE